MQDTEFNLLENLCGFESLLLFAAEEASSAVGLGTLEKQTHQHQGCLIHSLVVLKPSSLWHFFADWQSSFYFCIRKSFHQLVPIRRTAVWRGLGCRKLSKQLDVCVLVFIKLVFS